MKFIFRYYIKYKIFHCKSYKNMCLFTLLDLFLWWKTILFFHIHGQAAIASHTACGSNCSLTRLLMMAGSCSSMILLHSVSMSARIRPRAAHNCLAKSMICCIVVSSVMNWSISVTTSTQMEQVRSLLSLGRDRQDTTRQERTSRRDFIFRLC